MSSHFEISNLQKINIGIIGLGLIGGSLGLKLSEHNLEIYGFEDSKTCSKESLEIYKRAPFSISLDSYSNLINCDFVFLCVPLRSITNVLQKIQPYLKPNSIVTDVGSVKKYVLKEASKTIRKDCFFIGGHPMAGTEKRGFENAFPELFENKSWVLLSDSSNNYEKPLFSQRVNNLKKIIELTGANIIEVSAEKHDQAVAFISHLPLLISIGLLKTIEDTKDKELKQLALKLASSGYESMVRLAKGNETLNEDILRFNNNELKSAFKLFTDKNQTLLENLD
ncbi:MAG: prephenate dehydrogenase/arogenate dehydrogenase family protein [Candidatus Caenarcaniphilales bacterium]|nr:prephenate dehydrogenase/arogenate dehydrogenase family protein [Candidatus Caenarcaniphilales bacterium]